MVGPVRIGWKESFFSAGWDIPNEYAARPVNSLLFNKFKLRSIPRDLWNASVISKFNSLIDKTSFLNWWIELNGGHGSTRNNNYFLLDFPKNAWNIPWELLIDKLQYPENQARVIISRISGEHLPTPPSIIDDKLRLLILKGAPDGENLDPLDLDSEINIIQETWASLACGVRDRIDKPIWVDATLNNFEHELSRYKPHIIWFTGHGVTEPSVRLLFADRSWVDSFAFSSAIYSSGHRPYYAIFSACDTAKENQKKYFSSYPSLFEELTKIGLVSVLGMQSPIALPSAQVLTRHIFEYIAVGQSIETALARARAYLKNHPSVNGHPLDWASPVLWTIGKPLETIRWGQNDISLVQSQVLARNVLDKSQSTPQLLDAAVSDEDKERANEWIASKKVWITGSVKNSFDRLCWLQTLLAIQNISNFTVLAIQMDPNHPEESMKEWARNIIARSFYDDFSSPDILRHIKRLSDTVISGWENLLNQSNVFLSIADPPSTRYAWFWDKLQNANDMRVVILSDQPIPQQVIGVWTSDRFIDMAGQEEILQAYENMPRLARAMALLDFPIPKYCLSLSSTPEYSENSFDRWADSSSLLVDTEAGPILISTAKKIILKKIDNPSLLRQAHLDCLEVLDCQSLQKSIEIREKRIHHLMEAGLDPIAIQEADALIEIYRSQDLPFSVLKLLESLGKNVDKISQDSRLIAGWGFLKLGNINMAKYWLMRANPTSFLGLAWKHGLLAELYKSEGSPNSKQLARNEIEEAIDFCRKEIHNSKGNTIAVRRERAYRQDKARIDQFLFHEPEKAADEYSRLQEEWNQDYETGIDLAIVKRNFSECLRRLSKAKGDRNWLRAGDLITQAYKLAKEFPHDPALSEIIYEYAKFSEKNGDDETAKMLLLECIESAQRNYHLMMQAISENRLFWKYKTFNFEEWRLIEDALTSYSHHGWALRTLMNSRLSATKMVEKIGNFEKGYSILETNIECITANPSFNTGRDQDRIVRTYAGLHVLAIKLKRDSNLWDSFLTKYDWSGEWLKTHKLNNPEAIWEEV